MSRSERTIDLGVYPVGGESGRYHVRSSGRSGVLYLVDVDDVVDANGVKYGGCGCRDYEVRSGMMLYPAPDCKHLRAAKAYQKLQHRFGMLRKGWRQ